jgi:16S rRNA G966 N2-methylase RsmD
MPFLNNMLMQIARVSESDNEGLQFILNLCKPNDADSLRAWLKLASRHIDNPKKSQQYMQLLATMVALQPYVAEDTNLLHMTAAQIRNECSRPQMTHARLCDLVGAQFALGTIAFPCKRTYMGSVDKAFEALSQFQPSESTATTAPINVKFRSTRFPLNFNGGNLTLFGGNYATMDWIADYFTEEQRLAARRKDTALSPAEMWKQDGYVSKEILLHLCEWSPETIRERLFKIMPECTQFKPSIARSVYMKFGATRVLDFSAGWGDRLLGALSLPNQVQRYIAFDPNSSLQEGHTAMIDRFAANDPQRHLKYRVCYEPFESNQVVMTETFDLVFTSPPFYDFETYTNQQGQSILSFPEFDNWMNNFFLASLTKAWAKLDVGGHMVIHIGDVGGFKICQSMCMHVVDKLPGGTYVGVLCVAGSISEAQRPTWVFRKDAVVSRKGRKRRDAGLIS